MAVDKSILTNPLAISSALLEETLERFNETITRLGRKGMGRVLKGRARSFKNVLSKKEPTSRPKQ